MTIEEVIYQRVTETATPLAALIESRCFPLAAPQDAAVPSVVYQVVSSVPEFAHDGPTGLVTTRVQFSIVADDYATAKAVYEALTARFNAVRFSTSGGPAVQLAKVDNAFDDPDSELEPFGRVDVILIHTPNT